MNWWTSIAFYLWRNSVNRWLEQPLVVLSKLAISGLIGALGALMMLGALFLGDELSRQLASRDALAVHIYEYVQLKRVSQILTGAEDEDNGWSRLSSERLTLHQYQGLAMDDTRQTLAVYGVPDLEAEGYPDGFVLISNNRPLGLRTAVKMEDVRIMATVMPPNSERLEELIQERDLVLASSKRLTPVFEKGFVRHLYLQANSLDAIEQMDQVVTIMRSREGRNVNIRSSLPLLVKLREIRKVQGYILIVVTIGSATTLGLICGALAWMEFREERYLLSLIRSFGVGRMMLLGHAVLENCIVAVVGMAAGLGVLAMVAGILKGGVLSLNWLDIDQLLSGGVFGVLLLGALFGGLLSCVPVGIGLRKPLGLTLK